MGFSVSNQALIEWATTEDTTEIELPADLPFAWRTKEGLLGGRFQVADTTEAGTRLPDDITVATTAGTYTATYRRTGNTLTIRRHLVVAQDVIQPQNYPALETLLAAPLADARVALVLKRGDGE